MFERNKINVQLGELFIKIKGIDSMWKVEKILEFGDLPLHVRLVEQGGNNRTATVSYDTLMDTKFWKPAMPRKEAPAPTPVPAPAAAAAEDKAED